MEIPLCRKLRWSSGFHQQPEPLLLWVKHLVFLFFWEKIFFLILWKNIFLLFFEYKIMTDLETNILHSGVYIAWLWQCLQWAMAISILWPRLEGLNFQEPYKYWRTHLWLVVFVTGNFRMFQIMFLVVGLAMFTTVIPEAMVLVRSFSRCINARYVCLVKNQIRSW